MAKQEFLGKLRIARNLFAHPLVQTDGSNIDPHALEQMIARAAIWLTPKSVAGFNADDFPELGTNRQNELKAAVGEFLDVARQIPPDAPATTEQLDTAKAAFAKILSILQSHLPTPREGSKVEEAVKTVKFPPWLVNWDYEFGSNADGDPSVWVTLFADEQSAPRKEFGRVARDLNGEIHNALSAFGIDRWPYIRMRTVKEHKTA
ncbi:MAG: hypothetical protein K2R98_05915 [Gemmataceae bacterium]|nr:hypothetical protein [Gemmataceae bacterium]